MTRFLFRPASLLLLSALALGACGDKGGDDDDDDDDGGDDTGQVGDDTGGGGGGDADADGDGYSVEDGDCDDTDPDVHPGAADEWYDGIDSDCGGESDYDRDGDGYDAETYGGTDCDDSVATTNPGAAEVWYDGVDGDCAGGSDNDADGDGHDSDAHGGDDCDDSVATTNPGAAEVWYDGIDGDCAGDGDFDADVDGHDSDAHGGDDCDDTDAGTHAGAYDRPNDTIDQDCDGADRELDGIVLDAGTSLTETESLSGNTAGGPMDVVVLMDTTGSMGGALGNLAFSSIDGALTTTGGDVHYGFATFDDYAYSTYGYASSGDLPFILQQQVTDVVADVDTVVSATGTHYGGDGPESAMEGLYQTLTGEGYDQDCSGTYDSTTDVLPFIEDSTDPFGGTELGPYDSTTSGGGTIGGVGFRSGALPVVVYVSDYDMRDPDTTYPAPGGCPGDAGGADVAAAVSDIGAYLVGIQVNSYTSTLLQQMTDLADATGSYGDTDGDGAHDDPLTYHVTTLSTLNTTIATAVGLIDDAYFGGDFDEVWLEATVDTHGLVSSISPASYTPVVAADWPLDFDIDWTGALAATSSAQTDTVTFVLYGDGRMLDTFDVEVEVPPL